MTSNAYIATDGEKMMKVGKANNIKKREQQIGLPITISMRCPDEEVAILIETELRRIVVEMGGTRHPFRVDWFEYDNNIYLMLVAFAQSLDGFSPASIQGLPNPEITLCRKEYVRQLKSLRNKVIKEYLAERDSKEREILDLKHRVAYLESERERLRKELKEEREYGYGLIRKSAQLEGRIMGLKRWLREKEPKPLGAEWLLDVLNSIVPGDVGG